MKKINFAAAMRAAVILVSVLFVLSTLASCSGPLAAGEDLEQIGVKAEKALVEVENFSSSIEAEQTSTLVFTTSDGNKLTATVIGVTPRRVELTPSAENENSRTINVKLVGENEDGVTRVATTSYQQRKATASEPAPEPEIIDIRLEADTTMIYEVNNIQGWNNAYLKVGEVRRITRWSDGNETSEIVAERGGLISVHMAMYAYDQANLFIKEGETPKWEGIHLFRDETSTGNNGRDDEKRLEYTERNREFQCTITSSVSDLMEPVTVITRDVTYTDSKTGKSITWTFNGEMEYLGMSVNNGRVHAELQHSVNGVKYAKSIIDAALDIRK